MEIAERYRGTQAGAIVFDGWAKRHRYIEKTNIEEVKKEIAIWYDQEDGDKVLQIYEGVNDDGLAFVAMACIELNAHEKIDLERLLSIPLMRGQLPRLDL